MTDTKHDFECLIYICTCKKDEPMTTTKTYTYSFQVDPEIELHLGSYLKQYEEIGFNKALERIKELEFEVQKYQEIIQFFVNEYKMETQTLVKMSKVVFK